MKTDKFTVRCNICGSEDVSIKEDYDYDYDENITATGNYYLICNNCKETSEDY